MIVNIVDIDRNFIVRYHGRLYTVENIYTKYVDLRDLETNEFLPGIPRSLVSIY